VEMPNTLTLTTYSCGCSLVGDLAREEEGDL
jgi:hypothetical protein